MSIVLSCPSCTTRYRANPNAIGTNGRRVRCASCGHVWTAEVEDPSDLPSLQPAPPVKPDAPTEESGGDKKVHTAFRERQEKKRRTLSAAAAGERVGTCSYILVGAIIGVRTNGMLLVVKAIPSSQNSEEAQRENASSADFDAT